MEDQASSGSADPMTTQTSFTVSGITVNGNYSGVSATILSSSSDDCLIPAQYNDIFVVPDTDIEFTELTSGCQYVIQFTSHCDGKNLESSTTFETTFCTSTSSLNGLNIIVNDNFKLKLEENVSDVR